jgi:hypothetical protein
VNLIFQPHRYPRSMTREEWYRTWRWVRQTRKEQRMLAAALVCGNDRIRQDIMDQLVFPPLLIVPNVPENQSFDLRPGAICYVR